MNLPNGAGFHDYEDVAVSPYTDEEFEKILSECEFVPSVLLTQSSSFVISNEVSPTNPLGRFVIKFNDGRERQCANLEDAIFNAMRTI